MPRHDADGRQDARRGIAPHARPLPRCGRELRRHGRHVLRRRVGGDAGAVARRPARRGGAGDEVPLPRLRSGRPGARAGTHRQGVRREPAAPRRRRDRPLPGPRAGSRRPARGDARGARRARARRQGARARRLELPRLAARLGGLAAGPRGLGAVHLAAAAVLARRALDRGRDPAVLPRRGARRDPLGAARRGLPDRQVPARRAPARRAAGSPTRTRRSRRPTSGARPSATSASSTRRARSRRRAGRRSRRSRSRGCSGPTA